MEAQKYAVFISHRGPDTKKDFAILLKEALGRQRITAFHDQTDLTPGYNAPESMKQAMEATDLGIVILSPRFFESSYCMEELELFLKRGCVLPILFNLSTSECKADSLVSRLGQAWKSCRMEEGRWRGIIDQLLKVTQLKLSAYDGYWNTCFAEVVKVTAERLGRPVVLGARVDTTPYPRNKDFLGRDVELGKMREALSQARQSSLGRVFITGMGGMGKTQLALEYVYRYKDLYGSIFWINADLKAFRATYLALAGHLNIDVGKGTESSRAEDVVAQIRSRLEAAEVPCLLVLDNVEDLQADVARFLPKTGPCDLVATTRLKDMRSFVPVLIDRLGEADGVQLLRGAETFGMLEEQKLVQLAGRFGYLTLALAVSSRLFAEGSYLPSELLNHLNQKGAEVFATECADPVFEKHPDLIKLLDASFQMVARDAHADGCEKELASHLVCVGGWFAEAPIRRPLLAAAALKLQAGKDAMAEQYSVEQVGKAVGLLKKYALATETLASSDAQVVFHVLVQNFGKRKGQALAGVAMVGALAEVGKVDQEREHFKNALELTIQKRQDPLDHLDLKRSEMLAVVQHVALPLARASSKTFFQLSEASNIVALCRQALLELREPQNTLRWPYLWDVEGSLLQDKGKYNEAEPLYRNSLEIKEERLGSLHPDTARSLRNLAGLLRLQGRYGEAEPLYRRALEIHELQSGARHLDTAASLNDLARLLACRGEFTKAEPLYRRALRLREAGLGGRHPNTANSLNNLAWLLQARGQYDDAEPLYRQALDIYEEELGAQHPNIATSLSNLAGLLQARGQYGEAEPLYKRALEICEEKLGARHPTTAASLNNLAWLIHIQGRYGEAEPLHRRALAIQEEELGMRHPYTATSLENLARLLEARGKYSEAEALQKRALDIEEEKLGLHHPYTVACRQDLVRLRNLRRFSEVPNSAMYRFLTSMKKALCCFSYTQYTRVSLQGP
jgi:tetratricopeptide (TPR) repeat protein